MSIYINGYEWYVVFISPMDYRLMMPNGHTIGVTDLDTQTIYIANNLDDEKLYDVISHELCHALIFSYEINIEVSDEECVCQLMEVFSDDIQFLADKIYDSIK